MIAVNVPFGVMSILCTFKTSLVSGFSCCLVTTSQFAMSPEGTKCSSMWNQVESYAIFRQE